MKNSSHNDDLNELWVMLHQARDAIFKVRQKELMKYGISSTKASVLFNIEVIGDKATPSEIAKRLLRESHSASTILSRMEKQGLVRKTKDLDRKNVVRVSLTATGRQVYREAAKRESIREIMSCLSDTECRQLISCLKKIRNAALKKLGLEDRVDLLGY